MLRCKICGQPLNSLSAINRIRAYGENARHLSLSKRNKMRDLLTIRRKEPKRFTLEDVARNIGCSVRTVSRELAYLQTEWKI